MLPPHTTFIPSTPLPLHPSKIPIRPHFSTTCKLDPSQPTEPSRDLSPTDRQYLAKIKARFLNARRRAAAASSSTTSVDDDDIADTLLENLNRVENSDTPPTLHEDLDAMEDILFDRSPANVNQVKLFGGWLDDTVAGRKATSNTKQSTPHINSTTSTPPPTSATASFTRAMTLFSRGRYPEAIAYYQDAVAAVGPTTRLGGQYQLWHAQALDAAGRKSQAASLLQSLEAHSDAEVRKVARELLFILTAPRLQLDPGTFLEIPALDDGQSSAVSDGLLMSNYAPLRTAVVEKAPEPHSLQWYLKKERPPKRVDNGTNDALLFAAAVVGTIAFMAVSPH